MDILVTVLLVLGILKPGLGSTTFSVDVMSTGAAGDGRTDDSPAFLRAWEAVCRADSKVAALNIPAGRTFLLKPVTFSGPCKPSNLLVKISGDIVAPDSQSEYKGYPINRWITFSSVDDLIVDGDGKGKIDGKGSTWWSGACLNNATNAGKCKGPTALTFYRCNLLVLKGLRHVNSPRTHITLTSCKIAVLANLQIIAPGNSPNTDGIDISSSRQIHVRDSFIGTGDDCVAISAGSSNINVTRVICGPGHGISIGSLGGHGDNETVENVHVLNCTIKGTMTGVRIKTWQGGHGFAKKISFEKIKLVEVDNPIIIDQFYCPNRDGCQNQTSAIRVSDVSYKYIYGTAITDKVINLSCDQHVGCTNIAFDHVYIASTLPGKKAYSYCFNAHGKVSHTKPDVKCLQPWTDYLLSSN